ncbi:MAG: hypothetical protein HC859_09340 [Bacteroidia bacterium]|nr:hypothetical protein [Bacteroidia bacterium]
MKRVTILIGMMLLAAVAAVQAQKVDEERMQRDVEVAENILSTLIKQQFEGQRMFFPVNISGSYQPGFGVTFRLPMDFSSPMVIGQGFTFEREPYVYTIPSRDGADVQITTRAEAPRKDDMRLKTRVEINTDSLHQAQNTRVIEAVKVFIADYGDLLSQLPANEKVLITNQGDYGRKWGVLIRSGQNVKRTHLSVEALKSDMTQYKQGKISRDQMMAKIKVVNTEAVDEVAPDLELLSSIFGRLYRSDLSKTYFAEDYITFEQLKDFGVIYYMNVYSSNRVGPETHAMPTLGLNNLSQEERNKKVIELYPAFEKDIKSNIVDYGRTVKSLKDEEMLVVNVRLTTCEKCGIPSTVEFSIKAAELKAFDSGKIDKATAISKVNVKQGPKQ